ncbi:MAG: hypothetical protein MI924_22130 [Chloroflexales bacterium]|nr:hypothetical protein [Chloroflexales bacterium]
MPRKIDPDKARTQWTLATVMIGAGPEAVVVSADESHVQTVPLLRAMWQWVGQQIRIPTPESHMARAIFEALNIRSGQWTYRVQQRTKKEGFVFVRFHYAMLET